MLKKIKTVLETRTKDKKKPKPINNKQKEKDPKFWIGIAGKPKKEEEGGRRRSRTVNDTTRRKFQTPSRDRSYLYCCAPLPGTYYSRRLRMLVCRRLVLRVPFPSRWYPLVRSPPCCGRRAFASTATRATTVREEEETARTKIISPAPTPTTTTILYARDPGKDQDRNTLPKISFAVSSLNSLYWCWYVLDFVPAINNTPIGLVDEFTGINPLYGYGGLGLSVVIQTAFTVYPVSLVSKIAYRQPTPPTTNTQNPKKKSNTDPNNDQGDVLVWKHTLPFMKPSSTPLVFPIGTIALAGSDSVTTTILDTLHGRIEQYEGFLALQKLKKTPEGGPSPAHSQNENTTTRSVTTIVNMVMSTVRDLRRNFPVLLIDIRSPHDVPDPTLLLHTLVLSKTILRRSPQQPPPQLQQQPPTKVEHPQFTNKRTTNHNTTKKKHHNKNKRNRRKNSTKQVRG